MARVRKIHSADVKRIRRSERGQVKHALRTGQVENIAKTDRVNRRLISQAFWYAS